MNEIPSRYNPKETEDKWYKSWEENNLFSAKSNPAKKPFCVVIPPPNITGILHMGHALNNTIQDVLIRYHRMKGEESLWMPGTDHAGIATQNVVEKEIAKDGLKRQDLGREKFLERVWQWKEQYGSTIIHQLKKLGASCDWPRARFTMDEEYSKAVRSVFVALWNKGLIYQDDKVINWCPRCQTALSDEEAPHSELQGNLYYIRYPLRGQSPSIDFAQDKSGTVPYVVVATTRPETMLGDTAVAVNPKDKRYKKFIGKVLILPLINREIKVIADSMVDMEFGTGAVKVTPAHDPNDYILGKKHKLEFINIMLADGRLNENAGDYRGMDRFEAREVILEDLKEKGLLEKVQPHQLSAGHCYRCHTLIEPYLSRQWFVRMKSLAKPAIEAVKKGKIKFYPKRWTKVYLNWMENIQDWCISRQIWWGHRIPIWYCLDCRKEAFASTEEPKACRRCESSNLKQDEDVLDTWFSSWLWPFATFVKGQSPSIDFARDRSGTVPCEELKYFYPTSVLVTAPEIIFFWVARMIMAGLEFMKDIPFGDVYIHGTVRDISGKKMSKSLGNVIDPLEIINDYGADALRFSLISIATGGQDIFLSKEKFQQGRNFANKIWNASRFILMNLEPSLLKGQSPPGTVPCKELDLCQFFKKEDLDMTNRWILSRFYSALKKVNKALDTYRFNEAAGILYGFFWHEFCDWYLELAKPALVNRKQSTENRNTQIVMYKVLEKSLRALHPFMPFITEEIWQRLNQDTGISEYQNTSIMVQPWPHIQEQMVDKKIEKQMESLFAVIKAIRNLRTEIEIKPEQEILVSIYPHAKIDRQLLESNRSLVIKLTRLQDLKILDANNRPTATISDITKDTDIYLHFSGIIEVSKEQVKIKKKISEELIRRESKQKTLENPAFIKNAPAEVIENIKNEKKELEDRIKRLEKLLDELHCS
ncbi:MAG: valine--tRNA ligase [Candidatus Omnitrophica bacterium]|nr:valine--tRNA ligase [Candidatus Omnitrophota bacterium]MCG2706829.1 valine--tRNA ligase [Candidatus Omnitrophota bacterium]